MAGWTGKAVYRKVAAPRRGRAKPSSARTETQVASDGSSGEAFTSPPRLRYWITSILTAADCIGWRARGILRESKGSIGGASCLGATPLRPGVDHDDFLRCRLSAMYFSMTLAPRKFLTSVVADSGSCNVFRASVAR